MMMQIEEIYQHFLEASGVTTDTRVLEKNNIFFALKGDQFDGNEYALAALEKGASFAVIDNKIYNTDPRCILVEDSLDLLQTLARYHRNKYNIPVIGLTGTNGKTTTKELIRLVLSRKYNTIATEGNFNNHIGVPLTLLRIKNTDEIAVIEMGANHIGEIALLCDIAFPDYGLITNIGKAHLEGFGGYEGVVKTKTELYTHIKDNNGSVAVHFDDKQLMEMSAGLNRLTYGQHPDANTRGQIISSIPFIHIEWKSKVIKTKLYGEYNFENVMAAIAVGELFEVDPQDIASAISEYTPDNSRSQLIKRGTNTIYLDAYNANPTSMMASIRNFEKQEAEKKALILGDMLELGVASLHEHKIILEVVKDKFKHVLLIGQEFMKAGSAADVHAFTDTSEAAKWLADHPLTDTHILVKGSRGIALEELLEHL